MEEILKNSEPVVIANFQEPQLKKYTPSASLQKRLILLGSLVTLALVGIGVWTKDWTFYLAATVAAMACFSIITQHKNQNTTSSIVISTEAVIIGQKATPIIECLGFWLEREQEYITVNIVKKHREIIPTLFVFPTNDADEVRSIMLQVLPEIEPPEHYHTSFGSFLNW